MTKRNAFIIAAALTTAALAMSASAATIKAERSVNMEEDLTDCMLNVGFDLKEDVTDKEIFAQIYDSLHYDMVDVGKMEVGDTIDCIDGEVEVKTLEKTDNGILVNGGAEEGGMDLRTEEDTNGWTAYSLELPEYVLVGEAQLSLADEITLNTYKMKEDGSPDGEGYDTVKCDAKELKEKLEELPVVSDGVLVPQQTRVLLEKGLLTEVTIDYVP